MSQIGVIFCYDKKVKGFSFIEILLVIAIVAIVAAAVTPFLSNFVLRNNFDITRDQVLSTLRKAQSYAMDKKDSQTWGVCLTGNNIRLYSGSCASPIFSEDFVKSSNVNLSGLSDTTFNLRGEPSAALNITVSSVLDSASITVNTVGRINVN